MQTPRDYWPAWAEQLQRWNMGAFAAWLLEAGDPLTVLGAQAFYFIAPFFNNQQVALMAKMLEDEGEVRAFAGYLRGEVAP